MATQAYQQAILIKLHNDTGKGIYAFRRTGYINVTIGGIHYYYDSLSSINWTTAFGGTGKKGIIVIKKT